jgi:hypothetical protein
MLSRWAKHVRLQTKAAFGDDPANSVLLANGVPDQRIADDPVGRVVARVFLTTAALLCLTATPFARPQLHTQSIGWINPSDISCEQTSDHTCVVTNGCGDCDPYAFTWIAQHVDQQKYRVSAGTKLVIINEGKENKPTSRDDDSGSWWSYDNRIEVAIVIPADWGANGLLRPKRTCQLITHGKAPPIVSLSCPR